MGLVRDRSISERKNRICPERNHRETHQVDLIMGKDNTKAGLWGLQCSKDKIQLVLSAKVVVSM